MGSPCFQQSPGKNQVIYMPDSHPGAVGGPGASLYQEASSAPPSDPGAGALVEIRGAGARSSTGPIWAFSFPSEELATGTAQHIPRTGTAWGRAVFPPSAHCRGFFPGGGLFWN